MKWVHARRRNPFQNRLLIQISGERLVAETADSGKTRLNELTVRSTLSISEGPCYNVAHHDDGSFTTQIH
jgi:hypothetical protein